MATVPLTVYTLNRTTGVDFTTNKTAATAGNTYTVVNDGTVRLMLLCSGGGTATVTTPGTVDGLAIGDLTLTLTAAKQYIFGTFPPGTYGTTLSFTVSANTDVLAVRG